LHLGHAGQWRLKAAQTSNPRTCENKDMLCFAPSPRRCGTDRRDERSAGGQ